MEMYMSSTGICFNVNFNSKRSNIFCINSYLPFDDFGTNKEKRQTNIFMHTVSEMYKLNRWLVTLLCNNNIAE